MFKDSGVTAKQITLEGFGDETEDYRNVAGMVVVAAAEIINRHSIPYDYENLEKKLSELKITRRDGMAHEWVPESNTLYISKFNQEGEEYNDEDMIIATTHELMHLVAEPENLDEFSEKYIGFNEFFTEYLTSLVVSKVGGIRLESFYKRNAKGYFGNDIDHQFIEVLSKKLGFRELLNCYLTRDVAYAEGVIGIETLASMNIYFNYCDHISDQVGKPLREFNEIIQYQAYDRERQIIESLVREVENSIQS